LIHEEASDHDASLKVHHQLRNPRPAEPQTPGEIAPILDLNGIDHGLKLAGSGHGSPCFNSR